MINEITDVDSLKWSDFINSKAESNIFHTKNWLKVLKDVYGYEITLFVKVNSSDEIISGFPVAKLGAKYVSLPFSDYVPLLGMEAEKDILKDKIFEINSRPLSIVLKDKILNDKFVCVSNDVIHFGYYSTTFSDVEDKFVYNHKWGVKKARKEGLYVKIHKDIDGIERYYKLHLMTRKRQGTPSQSFKFFKSVFENIIEKNLGIVSLVYKGNTPVAGGVYLHFNKTFTHKYSASDYSYWKMQPNNLLMYEMIKYAVENGFKVFDFGKTDLKNEGLRKFKSGWGAEEKPLYYSYYPDYKESKLFEFAKDRIVAPVIKHSPKFVCRMVGEAFYKYSV